MCFPYGVKDVLARWYQVSHFLCPTCHESGHVVERQLVCDESPVGHIICGAGWLRHRCGNESLIGGTVIEPVLLSRELFIWDEVKK